MWTRLICLCVITLCQMNENINQKIYFSGYLSNYSTKLLSLITLSGFHYSLKMFFLFINIFFIKTKFKMLTFFSPA
jgi:hypothetical protein